VEITSVKARNIALDVFCGIGTIVMPHFAAATKKVILPY